MAVALVGLVVQNASNLPFEEFCEVLAMQLMWLCDILLLVAAQYFRTSPDEHLGLVCRRVYSQRSNSLQTREGFSYDGIVNDNMIRSLVSDPSVDV